MEGLEKKKLYAININELLVECVRGRESAVAGDAKVCVCGVISVRFKSFYMT